jgi:hypothetical protein
VAHSQVNDPPVFSLPVGPNVAEDVETVIPGLSVSDPEDDTLTVSLFSNEGLVVPSLVTGTPAVVNAALSQLTFTSSDDYSGLAVIDIDMDDGPNHVHGQIQLSVDAVVPQLVLPDPPTGTEDTLLQISGVSLVNVDGDIEVNLWSPNGSVSPPVFIGDASTVNQALAQISFQTFEDGSGDRRDLPRRHGWATPSCGPTPVHH